MPAVAARLDPVFRALADPTRRALLRKLAAGPASVGELAEPFDMALPSLLQHLQVLEDGGLVRSEKSGRIRTFRGVPEPLQAAEDWMSGVRNLWERRLDQLDAYLSTMKPVARSSRKKAKTP